MSTLEVTFIVKHKTKTKSFKPNWKKDNIKLLVINTV